MLSFGGGFASVAAVPGVQIALDLINANPHLLPGYTLHYSLSDSQVFFMCYSCDGKFQSLTNLSLLFSYLSIFCDLHGLIYTEHSGNLHGRFLIFKIWNSIHFSLTMMQCNHSVALKSFFHQVVWNEPVKLALIGSGCSVATEPTADISHFYNITQVLCLLPAGQQYCYISYIGV